MADDPWAAYQDVEVQAPVPAQDPWSGYQDVEVQTQAAPSVGPWARFGVGLAQPIVGAAQLLARGAPFLAGATQNPVAQSLAGSGRRAAAYLDAAADQFAQWAKQGRQEAGLGEEAELFSPSTWDVPATAGEILSPVNIGAGRGAGLAVKGLGALRNRVFGAPVAQAVEKGSGVVSKALRRAAEGAGYGATAGLARPVTSADTEGGAKSFGEVKAEQARTGAIGGAIGGPIAGAAGDVIGPRLTPAARYLLARGVELSPGQILKGLPARIEGLFRATPISGEVVREAQQRAIPTFNRAAYNDAMADLGLKLPADVPTGRPAMQRLAKDTREAYKDVHGRMSATMDRQLLQDLSAVLQDAAYSLDRPDRANLRDLLFRHVVHRFRDAGGALSGPQVQAAMSRLKETIRDKYAEGKPVARFLDRARRSFDRLLERQNSRGDVERLRAVNRAYAKQKILEDASSVANTGAQGGEFSPQQLAHAIDRSTTDERAASGKALLQELSEAGQQVIPNRVPDATAPERAALFTGLGVGAYHGLAPHALGAIAGVGAAYTRPVQNFLRAAIAGAPNTRGPLGDAVRRYGPLAATPLIIDALERRDPAISAAAGYLGRPGPEAQTFGGIE